jgi:hypothetical protein
MMIHVSSGGPMLYIAGSASGVMWQGSMTE